MNYLLEVKNINKRFGDHTVLENVSFQIRPGEIVGLVGRNGMGKTTLMKCILGLIKIDSGEISFKGKTGYHTDKAMMDEIGYLLDCKLFENLNAYENIKIQEWYKGERYRKEEEKKVIEDILNLVDLKNDKKKVKKERPCGRVLSNSFNFAVIPLLAAGDVGVLEVPSPPVLDDALDARPD